MLDVNVLTQTVIDAGLKVHRTLGPGLLESTYESCLIREFEIRSLPHRRQVAVPLEYEGLHLDTAYRLDIVVADRVIVEIKAVAILNRLHESQLLTYLRLTGIKVGLLMNFNVALFKHGLRRLAL